MRGSRIPITENLDSHFHGNDSQKLKLQSLKLPPRFAFAHPFVHLQFEILRNNIGLDIHLVAHLSISQIGMFIGIGNKRDCEPIVSDIRQSKTNAVERHRTFESEEKRGVPRYVYFHES